MKQLFILLASLLTLTANAKKIYLNKQGDGGIYFTGSYPGDTLVLRASQNPFTYIALNVYGRPKDSVTIIPEGGQVVTSAGFDLSGAQYVKLDGLAIPGLLYGFKVSKSGGAALNMAGKALAITVRGVEADGASFGLWLKNEVNTTPDTSILNFVIRDIWIDHCWFKNISIEGMYMGSTDADNNRVGDDRRPTRLGNIKITYCKFKSTGRPSIMLSNASEGLCEIAYNEIDGVGAEGNDQQGTGIALGLYTKAWVHDNYVKNTYTWGIAVQGAAYALIENNRVDSSGSFNGKRLNWPQNIQVTAFANKKGVKTNFIIRNNTLSNPGTDVGNVQVWGLPDLFTSGNVLCGNKLPDGSAAKVAADKGIVYSTDCAGTQPTPTPVPNPTPVDPTPQPVPVKILLATVTVKGTKYNLYNNFTFERADKASLPALPTYILTTNADGTLTLKKQ